MKDFYKKKYKPFKKEIEEDYRMERFPMLMNW
jgi:hypothetical protein